MKDDFEVVAERKGGEARRRVESARRERRWQEDSNISNGPGNGMKHVNGSAEHTSSRAKANGTTTHFTSSVPNEAPSRGVDMPESRPDSADKVVTLDMLKALTRDIKIKYGAGGL